SMVDLEKKRTKEHGTVNELELILGRGAGLFVDATPQYVRANLMGQFVCDAHMNELLRGWNSRQFIQHIRRRSVKGETFKLCGITTHDRVLSKLTHHLTKEQAQKYLHHYNRLYHIGIPICPSCAAHIDKLAAVFTDTGHNDSIQTDEPMDDGFDGTNEEMVEARISELQAAFAHFADKAQVKGIAAAPDFGGMQPDTKRRRVYAMKKLVKVMVSLIAPNDEDELMRLYIESLVPNSWMTNTSSKLAKVFEVIAEQYEKTEDRRSKEIILSSIVNVIGLRDLQNYIPGFSSRKYHNAKLRARSSVPIVEPVIRRCRYEPIRIHYFVAFITSAIVSTGLPYGERDVTTSDGSKLSIPNTIRLHSNAEIIRMYKKHMEDIGKKHLIISDSVAYGILKKCSATRRHALLCVDYFLADGADAFEDIDDILDTLQGCALLEADMAKLWKIRPEKVNLYDLALQLFKKNLDDVQAHNNILAEVSEAVIDMTTGENHDSDEGWALKGKRKYVVYSKKAKKFAEKLFNLGDRMRGRWIQLKWKDS
ncbi:hypothetical protein PMAYCL1PPCAC_31477, partial [Pristionchus mayeri]